MKLIKKYTKTLEFKLDDTPINTIAETVINAIQNNPYSITQDLNVSYEKVTELVENHRRPIKINIYTNDWRRIMDVYIHPYGIEQMLEMVHLYIEGSNVELLTSDQEHVLKLIILDALSTVEQEREEWINDVTRIDTELAMAEKLLNQG